MRRCYCDNTLIYVYPSGWEHLSGDRMCENTNWKPPSDDLESFKKDQLVQMIKDLSGGLKETQQIIYRVETALLE